MALIDCPECSVKVSDKAATCPHCGYPLHGQSPTTSATANTETTSTTAVASGAVAPLADPEVVPLELTMGKLLRRHVLLTDESITVGGTTLSLSAVESLRWGTLVENMQVGFIAGSIATHRTIWIKTSTDSVKIACSEARVVQPAGYGDQWVDQKWIYEALKVRLWWHRGVDLMLQLLERIFSGETVSIGGVELTRDGAMLKHPLPVGIGLGKKLVPWKGLSAGNVKGELMVSNSTRYTSLNVLKHDNAPILCAAINFVQQLHEALLADGKGDLAEGILKMLRSSRYDQSFWRGASLELYPDW